MNHRVVLVDDDASIRRWVEMALEDLAVDLVSCASVSQACQALQQQPAKLMITDLMMPGQSGFDLLAQLAADPALRGGALLAVFSAGLSAAAREKLAGLDVWRELHKPVSLAALEACVLEALAWRGPSTAVGPAPEATTAPSALAVQTAVPVQRDPVRHAIDRSFGGDAALHAAFQQHAAQQFQADRQEGDRALAAGDWPALRRLAHSLKSVLAMLGAEPGATLARQLEAAADSADAPACQRGWAQLRLLLMAPGPQPR